jgi:hypothetical protein
MVKDRRPRPGMPFLDRDTCAEGGVYLFLPGFSSLYDAIHGWMTGWMDRKSFRTTTSFTICNGEFDSLYILIMYIYGVHIRFLAPLKHTSVVLKV